jgi:4-hydroxy-4-methyl-2-oxoglutarate aldolase
MPTAYPATKTQGATRIMRRATLCAASLIFVCAATLASYAQLGMFTKEQRIDLTREWKGDRFDDGRPKVPDSVLQELKDVDAEEAWGVLQSRGYRNQFEGGWHVINAGPDRTVGRVFTAVFMPMRPDVNAVINDHGKEEKRIGAQNSWPIDMLSPGDVLVVDLFGKIKDGTYAGDNLGTAIFTKSHNALIVDGSVRDETGISKIKGLRVFVRGTDPSALRGVTLMGINVPIRIGHVMVMPGDVVVSDPEGLTFIPPQLCQEVVDRTAMTHLVDEWGHMMLREGKYTPGEIDHRWTKPMIEEFNKWLKDVKGSKRQMKEN